MLGERLAEARPGAHTVWPQRMQGPEQPGGLGALGTPGLREPRRDQQGLGLKYFYLGIRRAPGPCRWGTTGPSGYIALLFSA